MECSCGSGPRTSDAAAQAARALGAQIVEEPHENPNSGKREIWVRNPDGYVVVIAGSGARSDAALAGGASAQGAGETRGSDTRPATVPGSGGEKQALIDNAGVARGEVSLTSSIEAGYGADP